MFRLKQVALLASFVFVVGSYSAAFGRGNEVQFSGTVIRLDLTSSTQGTITLRVMGLEVPVRITGDTEIETDGDEIGLKGIRAGDFVKVSGFFTNSAIVAREIEVVDRGIGEFRLRGPITSVRLSGSGTIITILGVDVLVDANTKIERRGPDGGFTASNLSAGLFVDMRGTQRDGQLVAARVKVGDREDDAIRVQFAGRITRVDTGRLVIDTEGGSTAVVLISSATVVVGTPAVGQFAEVRGTLNQRLEVVSARVRIKANKDADEDDERPPEGAVNFEKKISLSPAAGITARGIAEIELEQRESVLMQKLEIEIEKAQPSTEFRIRVEISPSAMVDFGTLPTNREGSAEVKFTSAPRDGQRDIRPLLPAGKTVRDFVKIQILNRNGAVVLEGRF